MTTTQTISRKLFTCTGCGAEGLDEPLESRCHCSEDGAHWVESVLFTSQPAPVAVPDDEQFRKLFESWCPANTDRNKWHPEIYEHLPAREQWAAWNACRAAMLQNDTLIGEGTMQAEPVTVPDGWKLVPVEPTEKMVIEGFESEPDESFSPPEVWEAYDAMSGCQQAAHRATLCWTAMLAAAPAEPEQGV